VNVGVTNNGDIFGGTQVSFGDVLGDKQVNFFAASISQYRTLSLSYVDLSRRFQWALQGFSQTQFFYGQVGGYFYDPSFAPLLSRDDAIATRTIRGGSIIGIYPFSRYRRAELSAGLMQLDEQYNDPGLQQQSEQYQQALYGTTVLQNGTLMPLSAAYVQETTVFREFGPLAGSTMRLAYTEAPPIKGLLSRRTLDGDARYYQRIGATGLLATRIRGFKSFGDFPDFQYFGGNSELRGYDYLQFAGSNVMFANAELRFPLIEAALTPIGVIGGVRGVFFAGIGGAWFSNSPSSNPCTGEATGFKFANSQSVNCQVPTGYKLDVLGNPIFTTNPQTGQQTPVLNFAQQGVSGFRLQDGRASYGLGLETFALGFPIHFDWSWRTLLNRGWEDVVFACTSVDAGGKCISSAADFRKPRFAVWIGYDF
jgi:outer membrane protein assembly factor BamA